MAVGVWYRAGSAHEWQGRTGLAHLIEHLMFDGSAGYPQPYFDALEQVGVTDINAVTGRDRTAYFQTVPSEALDRVLWLEAERMGWMTTTEERLKRQTGVVQNERLMRQNAPYGNAWDHLAHLLYGEQHPYSWPTIGFDADLVATEIEDIQRFRNLWYAPGNAVLVIAGDIDPETTRESVEAYFAPLPPAPEVMEGPQAPLPELTSTRHREIRDQVPHPRLYRAWIAPPAADIEQTSALFLACRLLGGDSRSLLYRRLVLEEKLANFASCYSRFGKLAGEITLAIEARGMEELRRIEVLLDQLIEEFRQARPEKKELKRLVQAEIGSVLRSFDKLGGYGGRVSQLAEGAALTGDPRLWEEEFVAMSRLAPASLRQEANTWLGKPWAQVLVLPGDAPSQPVAAFQSRAHLPQPEWFAPADRPENRPPLPAVAVAGLPEIPPPEQWRLVADCPAEEETVCAPTGIDLYLVQRPGAPLVSLDMQFQCRRPDELEPAGLANFAVHLMSQGTVSRDRGEIKALFDDLSGVFNFYARADYCGLAVNLPARNLSRALPLIEEMIFHPRLDESEMQREQDRWVDVIAGEYSSARTLAFRLLPPLLYGDDHSYGVPATGTGYGVRIAALTADEVRDWHQNVFRRDKASLILAGDWTEQNRQALFDGLEQRFSAQIESVPAERSTAGVSGCPPVRGELPVGEGRLIFVPAPGRSQSVIVAGQLIWGEPSRRGRKQPPGACLRVALEVVNEALGGSSGSRLNRILREEKGWSYGAHTAITDPAGTPAFFAFTSVQADKTAEALQEIRRIALEFNGEKTLNKEEWRQVRSGLLRQLPGSLETLGSLRQLYSQTIGKGRSGASRAANWWSQSRMLLIQDLRLSELRQQARRIQPENWVWIVVGDPGVLESLQKLGLGEVEVQKMEFFAG